MAYYTIDLMSSVLHGPRPWEMIPLAWRIGRSRLLRQHRSVFHLGLHDLSRVPLAEIPGYTIQSFLSWRDVDGALRRELDQNRREIWWNVEAFLDGGGRTWIGRYRGRLANIGGSRTGDRAGLYFFPAMPSWVVFSHFVTLPAFRGLGLFQSLLAAMVHQLAMARIDQFFIDCHDWNLASIRGIERTGFHFLGTGIVKRTGRLAWFPAPLPTGGAILPLAAPPYPAGAAASDRSPQ